MEAAATQLTSSFASELKDLFFIRTRLCLWLGVVFFSLFALLDFIRWREFFPLLFTYRLSFVIILLIFLRLLSYRGIRPYARFIMSSAMLLGTLTITLMTIKLGGFSSDYYVGILLMIAGGFSALPFTVSQALLLGGMMFLVYGLTTFIGTNPFQEKDAIYLVNNSFFFLSIIAVTTVQCFDDIQTQLKSLQSKKNLRNLHHELRNFTHDLEILIEKRMESLEESELKFRDLYNNILDLVILIDREGLVCMVNQQGAAILDESPDTLEGKMLADFLNPRDWQYYIFEIMPQLSTGASLAGVQMQMQTTLGRTIEVELGGNRVDMPDKGECYQLIFRDITDTKRMEKQLLESTLLIDSSRQAAIFGLARLAECRHEDTGAHLIRIRTYTRILAMELAKNPDLQHIITDSFIEDLCLSSVLHDIGKVGIPDSILLKPGKLSEREFEIMKQHCEYGSIALSSAEKASESVSFLKMGQEISSFHHERWDGKGYPHGLADLEIPLSARIVTLADVYDALTSSRTYKPAYNHEQAKQIIVEDSGRRFDPTVVNAFLRKEQEFKNSRKQLLLQARTGDT